MTTEKQRKELAKYLRTATQNFNQALREALSNDMNIELNNYSTVTEYLNDN